MHARFCGIVLRTLDLRTPVLRTFSSASHASIARRCSSDVIQPSPQRRRVVEKEDIRLAVI
jgi:hypothetical protein